jgi:hypothetical protein
MTQAEWNELSWLTVSRLEDWRDGLVHMITVLRGWEIEPPPPSPGFDTSEGAGETPDPEFNERLNKLAELSATRWSIKYGEQLLQWVTDCLALLTQYDKAFAVTPNDAPLDNKAQADLQTIKEGYNRLCAWSQERPLF